MEKITPITEELKQLGSALGSFPVVSPYKVPAGYFDEFPARMFILISGGSLPAVLPGLSAPYEVPGGYFDNLADIILKKAMASSAGNQSSQHGQPSEHLASRGEDSNVPSSEKTFVEHVVSEEEAFGERKELRSFRCGPVLYDGRTGDGRAAESRFPVFHP